MKERITITVNPEMKQWYQDIATEKGISVTAVVVMAMKDYMDATKALEKIGGVEGIAKFISEKYGNLGGE